MGTNNTAFIKDIKPNATGAAELGLVHQTSPAWVLTFLRWQVRDTLRTNPTNTVTSKTISPPLVVESDCIQVSVSDSKSVLTPSVNLVLLVTDVNYETELSPGDFVFVNNLNWEADAVKVANKARNLQPINGANDGFKGFFKIQSVRKTLAVDPTSGVKMYAVKVTGYAFTEFNTSIYFNPYLIGASDQNALLFASYLGIDWALIQNDKGLTQIQLVLQALIQSFIGNGFNDNGRKPETGLLTPNVHFFMPTAVGNLLGLTTVQSAKDVYNYLFGIQQYGASTIQSLAQGMNPTGIPANATSQSRFMMVPGSPVEGNTVAKPEYWNQVKAWSILNQFTNSPLNELYTCFRISPNGSVMPTVVLRQIPFTTSDFVAGSYQVTRFMNVPRWRISPALVFGFDLGKDDVARFNFVQYYGRAVNGPANYDISEETAKANYLYDIDDVQRSGLRPYVVTSEFDRVSDGTGPVVQTDFRSPGWARIVGDALIGGHLKMSGTISCVGIVEPIAVGDNLEFDGVVYHIEQISHVASIDPNGRKTFRTNISVSNGMHISNTLNTTYAEMKFGSAYDARTQDYKNAGVLPGVSESQNTPYRANLDTPHATPESFVQPNTNTSVNKGSRQS